MKNPYSSLKVAHHRKHLDVLRAGGQPTPLHVQFILSDLCQQSCSFCAYRWDGYTSNELFHVLREDGTKEHNPNRMVPTSKAVETLDDCADMGVKAVQFTGGGEPTLHPDHPMLFEHTLSLGLKAALVTNGVVWRCPKLLQGFSWVRFSLDAGNPATYARVRKANPTTMGRVLEHVSELAASGGPLVGIGFVVTKDNWREVIQAAELAKIAGVHSFRISAVFQPDNSKYFEEFHSEAAELCRGAATLSTSTFRVSNMFGDRISDLDLGHPDYSFCGYQNFTTYIGGDQNVYRCCNLAYSPRGLIGSIKEQSFRQLWESQTKRDGFSAFDATGCPRCQFNDRNHTINELLEKDPLHVEFV
jgi:MoaA/NifB/PqqE/SkfB family radical SAM enzyme